MSANYFTKTAVDDMKQPNLSAADWTDVALLAPLHDNQALLYEIADCLSVRAFLKMLSLPFRLDQRPNAEFMTPTGKVPILRLQERLVSEFEPIVATVAKKGLKLSALLTDPQLIDMYAHMALIEETLKLVEMHIVWFDKPTYNHVTKHRYGAAYSWPLRSILPPLKRQQISTYLEGMQWREKTPEHLLQAAERVFRALSAKLADKHYFMGSQPTELDALAFGHLHTILSTKLPNNELAELLRKNENLVGFCKRIDLEYFTKK